MKMIIEYSNGSWRLATKKVTYTNGDNEEVMYTADTSWIEQTAALHDHINISSIEDVTFTKEQQARFQEIQNMPEDFGLMYSDYVDTGKVELGGNLRANHPFNIIYLRVSKKATEMALTDAEITIMEYKDALAKAEQALTDKDINDIERDLAITELEIEVAEIKLMLQP